MFNDELRQKAINIMDNLMKHPSSAFFSDEIIPGVDTEADYLDYVKNPQDLKTIKKRLENKEYKTLAEWMTDVETVWNNAEIYNGSDSYFSVLSKEMRYQFEKERRVFCSTNVSSWTSEIYRLRVKMEDLIQHSPRNVYQKIPGAFLMNLPNEKIIKISEHEIQCLKIALETLSGKTTSKEIMRIIREKQPKVEPLISQPTLDFGVLEKPTIEAIKEYVKQALEDKGLKYPE